MHQLLISPAIPESPAWASLTPYLANTEVVIVDEAVSFKLGRITVDTALVAEGDVDEANANQLVCRINDTPSVLAPGDTDGEHLADIPFSGKANIVLVPHHGSRYSWRDDFYRRFEPDTAVISAGRGNRFGHPHAEVIEGLQKLGIPAYRTDKAGAIAFYMTENGTAAETYLKPQ